jgi:hypothetical protein
MEEVVRRLATIQYDAWAVVFHDWRTRDGLACRFRVEFRGRNLDFVVAHREVLCPCE